MRRRPIPPPPIEGVEPHKAAEAADLTAREWLAADARALLEAVGTARRDRLSAQVAELADQWARWLAVIERFEAECAERAWPEREAA